MSRPRLVVLRALNLGDVLTGIPALRALRRHFGGHHITFAGPAAFGPLLQREGLVDAISDTYHLAPLERSLEGPEVAVDLHGRGPGSQPLLLALDPGRLIAFSHPAVPATAGLPVWRPEEHEVARWTRLLCETGIAADARELHLSAPVVEVPGGISGATVIHPGAAAPSRRWPVERFAAVARSEMDKGRPVAVTGGSAERPLAARLLQLAGPGAIADLSGRTGLDELMAVVAAAGRIVSGDTGVAHLAFALRAPSVTLYGPVPPSEWGPPPDPRHRVLWTGGRGDPHGDRLDPGLDRIGVADVQQELDRLDVLTRLQLEPTTTAPAGVLTANERERP